MAHLLYRYKRGPRGFIMHREFNSDAPAQLIEGWYDSPDKVPPLDEPMAPHPMIVQQQTRHFGPTVPAASDRSEPRRKGWPKGKPRGPRKAA